MSGSSRRRAARRTGIARTAIACALALVATAPLATAQTGDELTRSELLERSGRICANAIEATATHERRVERAADEQRFGAMVRHGRRFIRAARPYVRRLGDLRAPAQEGERYRNFTEGTRLSLNWLDAALDAVAARRWSRAERRLVISDRHLRAARRAARRYPLRRSCIRFLS